MILDVEQIIDGGVVDDNRIEYKRNWNPEPILHTICAFANDIDNQGGGYIIVGIEESSGRPGEIIGVPPESVDGMNRDLLNLCNLVDPRILVSSEYDDYKSKHVFVIKVAGGNNRPYKCPISLSQRKSEKGYYIRKMGSTIRANSNDEKELFDISKTIPFDDRVNNNATLSDLDQNLMRQYLNNVRSRTVGNEIEYKDKNIAASLHVIGGPAEDEHPLNVGLMFFNYHPDDFFKNARIEIIFKPEPTGHRMIEHTVDGPLDNQLRSAINILKNNYISEYVTKTPDRAEAIRQYNYPLEAVEEALSNAVYHKAYDISEPISVYIYPDRMEITSIPGPDRSISDDDLERGVLVSRRYRNRRIGEFLKDLKLAEGRNTGIPLMIESLRRNGSGRPRFITDADRSFMTVIIPINPNFKKNDTTVSDNAQGVNIRRTSGELSKCVIRELENNGEMSIRELSNRLGYQGNPPSSLRNLLKILLATEVLELTEPDKPRSPNQKIRIGKRYL